MDSIDALSRSRCRERRFHNDRPGRVIINTVYIIKSPKVQNFAVGLVRHMCVIHCTYYCLLSF